MTITIKEENKIKLEEKTICSLMGIDCEKIQFSGMKKAENKLPYLLLLAKDEHSRNVAAIAAATKQKEELPQTKKARTQEQQLSFELLNNQIETLNTRNNELEQIIFSVQDTAITPLAAFWAFGHGTKELSLPETAIAGLKEDAKKIRELCKEHYANLNTMLKDNEYHGNTYKELKSNLSLLFTHLYTQPITCNQADIIALLHCVMRYNGKIDNNANVDGAICIANNTTTIRKACVLLADKLTKREQGKELGLYQKPEKQKKGNSVAIPSK